MVEPVFEVIQTGPGLSFQDRGRRGWRRYGVPPGGAMDEHAAQWANVLLGNPLDRSVLEILLQGVRLRTLRRVQVALTGAAVSDPACHWETRWLETGEEWTVPAPLAGLWSYLAIRGGFSAPRWFGSVSIFSRGGLGQAIAVGDVLMGLNPGLPSPAEGIGGRWLDPKEQRDYRHCPTLPVWPGPQWDLFPETMRSAFFGAAWQVSTRSDRTGYRLEGPSVGPESASLPSEPVLPGSIQVPPDGQPIVTFRDGPTVGGYPKLGVIAPEFLSWLAQCRPGQEVRFEPAPPMASPDGEG